MLTLAIGELLAQVAWTWDGVTGGANGLVVPSTSLAGTPLTNLGFVYWYVLAAFVVGFAVIWLVARSPFGAALRGVRDNEPRMRAVGYATSLYKYAAFVLAGGVAGMAGALLAAQARLVTPADVGFVTSAVVLLAVVIGGAGSLWGAALGAALVITIRDALDLAGHGELVLGIVFVVVVYLLPRGLAGLASGGGAGRGRVTAVLACAGVSRSFGALRAVDGVDLEVAPGARHALIGPNGAGKSTLFKLVTGVLRPHAGTVSFEGRDVTRTSEVRRCRLGMSQTLQHSSLFPTMTAAATVALAVQRHGVDERGSRISVVPRRQADVHARSEQLLAEAGLDGRGGVPVPALSHGERKQLEVALALACRPRLLLLDEPAAGMSPAESRRLVELLAGLPSEITVLFVEHDLDLVFELADAVTVLHLGKVLLSGSPEQIRASEAVREAYLGVGRREELFTTAGGTDVPAGA